MPSVLALGEIDETQSGRTNKTFQQILGQRLFRKFVQGFQVISFFKVQ